MQPGADAAAHYGLLLAAAAGFPPDVLVAADEVVEGEQRLGYLEAGMGLGRWRLHWVPT